MTKAPQTRRYLLYLIPIVIGLGGVVFARQFDDLVVRFIIIAMSMTVPMVAGGSLLARYRTGRFERAVLFVGMLMLLLGGAISVSGLSGPLSPFLLDDQVPEPFVRASQVLGILSLILGLFVVLLHTARTGESIDEIAGRFELLADHITEGFILLDASGVVVTVNNRFLDMTGLTREEVVGHHGADLSRALQVEPVQEHFEKRIKGMASEYELEWTVRGEQRLFWFSGTPIFDSNNRQTASLTIVRDITEHDRLSRRVERYAEGLQELVDEQTRKLRISEERFRQLLESMNEGFLTIDLRHRIRFANERIGQMLECVPKELIGRDIFEFVDVAGRVRLLNMLSKGANLRISDARQEIALLSLPGTPVPVVVAMTPIEDAGKDDPAFSLVVTSVADLKKMERKLRQRATELERVNEELRAHDRAKDSFLSNVSHELRTPLSTIQGYLEMLMSDSLGELAAPQQGAVEVMSRNVERLISLINEMIEFSRMEIRGVQLSLRLFSPARLVQEGVDSVQPTAIAKDITVNAYCEEAHRYTWGDPEKLTQVLGILLNNAVKFTDPGGMVQVRVTVDKQEHILISVADSGIGIAPEHHDKIFGKFFQVDGSKTRRYEGTGIGLSIAKGIVEAHGGTLRIESDLGSGSNFVVDLNAAAFTYDPPAAPIAARVLTVSKGIDFSAALGAFLETHECTQESAENGHACVRAAESFAPDLILLDDNASDVMGQFTVSHLRQNPATSNIPVVVCSGEPAGVAPEVGILWSQVIALSRPFDAAALTDAMQRALRGEGLQPDSAIVEPQAEENTGHPHVLVIDSDPGLLEWIEAALSKRQIPCYCARHASAGIELVQHDAPDIVLVDGDAPAERTRDQLALIERNENTCNAAVYMMTGLPEGVELAEDVSGVLRKPFRIEDVIALLPATHRATKNGNGHMPTEIH